MTLPNQIQLTVDPTGITSQSGADRLNYMKKLVYELTEYMQQTNGAVNGFMQQVPFVTGQTYQYVIGSTSAGTATYSSTTMWARRANLMNEVWFDITWSGATGTGNLLIQLPYYSLPSSNRPYVCVIENNGLTFDAGYTYLVGNLIPNTNTIEVRECGSGVSSQTLTIPSSGSLRGSIIYAGQQNR